MTWEIREGDCLDVLRTLDAGSVQTCVTSPPYWGLRDYGTASWEGGDSDCDHDAQSAVSRSSSGLDGATTTQGGAVGSGDCHRCGAKRIDSQLGLEPTPEQYVENLVTVFREVRRVLRDDGTVWLNLGDSYNNRSVSRPSSHQGGLGFENESIQRSWADGTKLGLTRLSISDGQLKEKDLVGIPWRVGFALQADGWWLRSDIIWAKPNPMPESVTDRPTRSHEYIFLLSKSARYFYDAEAIREGAVSDHPSGNGYARPERQTYTNGDGSARGQAEGWTDIGGKRNRRSVWTVTTQPYSEAHFATFPPKLIEPCILAGSPPKCCGECGAPWERKIERSGWPDPENTQDDQGRMKAVGDVATDTQRRKELSGAKHAAFKAANPDRMLGWRSTCDHDDDSGTATVLDPFAGAGTTGLVATQHGRDFIGIELNPEYAEMARERIRRYEANPAGALEGDPEPIEGQLGFL